MSQLRSPGHGERSSRGRRRYEGDRRPRSRVRTVRLAAVACVSALAVAACGGGAGGDGDGAGGEVTISFANWAITEEATTAGLEEAIAQFEQENPNINVENVGISFSDIAHQVLLQAQSGNAPCVAEMAGNYTLSLANAGVLQPLGDYVGSDFTEAVIPRELELGRINGELLAVPWTVAPFALWYNKDIMQQAGLDPSDPPQTIEEFEQALAAVKSEVPDIIPFGIDTTNRTFGLDSNWAWMRTFGSEPYTGSQAAADSGEMREYLGFMRTLATEGYTEVNQKIGYFRPIAADDKVAFTWDGPYLKGVIQNTVDMSDEEFDEKWGVTSLPTGSAGEAYTVPTDHQLVMLGDCEHQEEAWTFMKWLATSDWAVQNYTLEYESSLPPLSDPGGETAETLDTSFYQAFYDDVVPTVARPPWGEGYANVYSPIMAGVQRAMTSSASLDEIMSQMQSQAQAELN